MARPAAKGRACDVTAMRRFLTPNATESLPIINMGAFLRAWAAGICLCLTSVVVTVGGPKSAYGRLPPTLVTDLEKTRDTALASDYAWRQVAHLTENLGPRPAGSPQAQAALNYVAGELRRLGLDVRLEPVIVPHWV
jgi:hypothetical protein